MNRLQAMARIMMLLSSDDRLKPGDHVYRIVRKKAADIIDRYGPDDGLKYVQEHQGYLTDQIKILHVWYRSGNRMP
ncbi:MAG: hypothetical protein CR984_06300 [Proteobacteria bacterium]|nr:MAG: hypothetical protein CR984_06300 [Pseudomonadota bacterium]